jgi:hypothetical protein
MLDSDTVGAIQRVCAIGAYPKMRRLKKPALVVVRLTRKFKFWRLTRLLNGLRTFAARPRGSAYLGKTALHGQPFASDIKV